MNEAGAQDSGAWAQWTNWGFGLNQATNHNHNTECPRCPGIVIGASSMKRKDTKSAYINNTLWRALSVTLQ